MKSLLLPFLFVGFFGHFPSRLASQNIQLPERFSQLLTQTGIEFFEPVEAGYKEFEPDENEFQNCHFAIRSRKEDLQIRYFIKPWDDTDPLASNPHVGTFRVITNVASNADEVVISAIQPASGTLKKDFNADWGMVYFFQPKPAFSEKRNCRLISLYKEGRGAVFIFFLFDDPANEALDARYLALRFM